MAQTETERENRLAADLWELRRVLLGLDRIQDAGHTWVSARAVARELEKLLLKEERRQG